VGQWPIFCFRVRDLAAMPLAMEKMIIREQLLRLLEPAVSGLGYELYDLEFVRGRGHGTLRVIIDHADGVSLEACEAVSRRVSALLDVEDPLPGEYTLEVSSPGMDRRLAQPGHFDRFAGHQVNVRLKQKIDGRRRLIGTLAGRDGQSIRLKLEDGEDMVVALDDVDVARLVPEL
jgi:ribosome maturation factor RimP